MSEINALCGWTHALQLGLTRANAGLARSFTSSFQRAGTAQIKEKLQILRMGEDKDVRKNEQI